MDIDELKKQWKSMELRIDQLEKDNKRLLSCISNDKVWGVRKKLQTRYFALIVLCVVSPVWILLMNEMYYIDTEVLIIYTFFFVVMAVVNSYIYNLIGKVDCSSMTIKEALMAITKVEETRRRGQLLGWILAVPLVIILFRVFSEMGHPEVLYGASVGLVIGGIYGYIFDRQTLQLIKELRKTLADALAEEDI